MVPFNYPEFRDGLVDLVKKNAIPMSRIDDAVSRILRVKFAMGLFENPLGDYSLINEVGSQVSRCIALTIQLVLMKLYCILRVSKTRSNLKKINLFQVSS